MKRSGMFVLPLVLVAGCVGTTAPPPAQSTTTLTAADMRTTTSTDPNDRDAVLERARRRLEIATREMGVLEQEAARQPDESDGRTELRTRRDRRREALRRADDKRAELEAQLTRLAAAPPGSWSPLQNEVSADLAELESLVELAKE